MSLTRARRLLMCDDTAGECRICVVFFKDGRSASRIGADVMYNDDSSVGVGRKDMVQVEGREYGRLVRGMTHMENGGLIHSSSDPEDSSPLDSSAWCSTAGFY